MDLVISGLWVSAGGNAVVRDVSLEAARRQFTGILGPNGSGKSTLLRTIYRALKPSAGTILLGGKPVENYNSRSLARVMAVVGQFNEIDFEFTVEDIVMMGRVPHLKMLQREREEDYAVTADALEKVGMAGYAGRAFSSLSGGEKQRIILARAIAQRPRLLILDEPTNHLDITYQLQVLSVIKSLGITVLAALHDLELAARYCDVIYMLNDGRIECSGSPQEVITDGMIRRIYGVEADVGRNAATGALQVHYFALTKNQSVSKTTGGIR